MQYIMVRGWRIEFVIRKFAISVVMIAALPAAPALAENLLQPLPAKKWGEAAAVHLLRRAAFEGTPAEVEKLTKLSLQEAVDYLISYEKLPKPKSEVLLDPKLAKPPPREWLKEQDDETRRRYRQTRNIADRLQLDRIRSWWLERMVTSPRQLQEKMTLFWHGHFTSGYRETRSSHLLYEQNRLFRKHALGNYRTLLLGVSSDPAMLIYLDGVKNNKRQPNENYARELMELFTLGEGQYGEDDIKEAARAFTGWGVADGAFKFRPGRHDFGSKVFKGQEGDFNGGDIIDIILEDQQSQRFIVTKLWEFFCYENPERSVIDGLSATLRKSKFELTPVVRKILTSRGFYSEKARGTTIKSPVQLTVGTLRLLGVRDCDYLTLSRAVGAMGQQLFQPPNVKGWDGGERWINTATVFSRYNFCGSVVHGRAGKKQLGMMMKMSAGAEEFGFVKPPPRDNIGLPAYNPTGLLSERGLATPEQIVDFFTGRLLAVELPAEQRKKLIELSYGETGDFKLSKRQHLGRVRTMIHLLMSTPEYQVH